MITKKNYIKIYIWKIISIIMGFLSLLIVIPKLSEQQGLFGVYTLCISITIYLSYADLGFLSAGQKYAAEAFSKNDRKKEIEILGFTSAILLLMMLPFSICLLLLSYKPQVLINDLSSEHIVIAKNMFLTIAIALPITTLIQRITQTILSIRLKDYVSSRLELISSLLKVISVFYFFSNNNFLILEYYYFITTVSLLTSLILLLLIIKTESYDVLYLIKSIKFSRKYYKKLRKLAVGSLFVTIAWVIFYELDLVIISKLFTTADVAIYSIAFTVFNFLRTLFNIVYAPFYPRFNHLIGCNDLYSLNRLLSDLISYTFPFCIIVTAVVYVSAEHMIHFWVGNDYTLSVELLRILVISYLIIFVSIPSNYYIFAKEKFKYLNIISLFSIFVFSICVLLFTNSIGLKGIALSKSITLISLFIIYFMAIKNVIDLYNIIKRWALSLIFVNIMIVIGLPCLYQLLYTDINKNTYYLMSLVAIMGVIIVVSCIIIIFLDKQSRLYFFSNFKNIISLAK